MEQIKNGEELIGVCDGSFFAPTSIGSASWIFKISNSNDNFTGNNITPGSINHQSAYRSELSGVIGIIQHLTRLSTKYKITNGKMTLKCDCLGVIKTINRLHQFPSTRSKHFDLLSILFLSLQQCPFIIKFEHVKGHQDDSLNFNSLDQWEQLNVIADHNAKEILWRYHQQHHEPPPLTPSKGTLNPVYVNYLHSPTTISSRLLRNLKHHIYRLNGLSYWESKFNVTNGNTQVIHHTLKKLSSWRQHWHSKWFVGMMGVGKWMKRWNLQQHDHCPRCLSHNETNWHTIQCTHPEALQIWTQGLHKLAKWMRNNHAYPGLTEALIANLHNWHNNIISTDIRYRYSSDLQEAINTQNNIGWNTFLFGAPCNSLINLQAQHLKLHTKKTSGVIWFSNVIKILWDTKFDLWVHRNHFIHNTTSCLHILDKHHLHQCIQREYNIGILRMDKIYHGLFSSPLCNLLDKNDNYKLQWLHSIWEARDRYTYEHDLEPWQKDTIIEQHIRVKLKFKKRKWAHLHQH